MKSWPVLSAFALVCVIGACFFGAAQMSVSEVATCVTRGCATPSQQAIFWEIRFPRVLIGFLVGAGLAIAGAALQTLTRNSLADPYLFGVVSGAGLGASLAIVSTLWFVGLPVAYMLPGAAFLGALLAVALVQGVVMKTFGNRTEHMLLAGVAVSFMLGAISHFVLFIAEPFAANTVIFWLLGSLARAEIWYVWLLAPVVLVCFLVLFAFGPRMDTLLLGDETAKSLGVNVPVMRFVLLSVCALLTACIVAYCGGIGFVGLMIPHIVRRVLDVTSRTVLLGCVLLGGSFIVIVDTFARVLLTHQELPIGILTAAIGSVFFLMAMRRQS